MISGHLAGVQDALLQTFAQVLEYLDTVLKSVTGDHVRQFCVYLVLCQTYLGVRSLHGRFLRVEVLDWARVSAYATLLFL